MKRKNDALIIAALLAATLIFFYKPLFTGRTFAPADLLEYLPPWQYVFGRQPHFHNAAAADGILQFYTDKAFYAGELRAGRVPLWNPYSFCGQPFAGNNKSAIFYPFNFAVFRLLPLNYAFGFLAALHVFLAGLFMFCFLRSLKAGREAALFGAAAYMFAGWFVGVMQISSRHDADIWLPLVLCLYELALRRKRFRFALLAGVALGVQMLAGFIQTSAYHIMFLFAYACWRSAAAWAEEKKPYAALRGMLFAGAAVVVAGGLSAAQVLPVAAMLEHVPRVPASFQKIVASGVTPGHFAGLFAPDFLGNPSKAKLFFQAGAYVEINVYVGICAMMLAVFGAVAARREQRGAAFFFVAASVAVVLMAMGTPLFGAFYYLVPGAKFTRPNRFLCLLPICIAALAAFGANALLRDDSRSRELPHGRLALSATACAALAAACLFAGKEYILSLTQIPESAFDTIIKPHLIFQAGVFVVSLTAIFAAAKLPRGAAGAILFIVAAADLIIWGAGYNTSVPDAEVYRRTQSIEFLMSRKDEPPFRIHSCSFNTLPANTSTVFGIEDIRGYDSLFFGRYKKLLETLDKNYGKTSQTGVGDAFTYVVNAPLIDFMNVRYLACQFDIRHTKFPLVFPRELRVYRNTGEMPRAFFVPRWQVMDDDNATKFVASAAFDPRSEVILAGAPGIPPGGGGGYAKADIEYHGPGESVVKIVAPSQGMLVVSDAYDKGWSVALDGRPAKMLRANVGFRAVAIPSAGAHTVEFRYAPRAVFTGVVAGFFTAAFVCAALMSAGLRRRKKRSARPECGASFSNCR